MVESGPAAVVGPVVVVGAAPGSLAQVRERLGGGRRVAILVGDSGDPAVMAAARAMADELFGPEGAVEAPESGSG